MEETGSIDINVIGYLKQHKQIRNINEYQNYHSK